MQKKYVQVKKKTTTAVEKWANDMNRVQKKEIPKL